MRNRKGFTLVEMLAMLVVLGILMVITVPNITGILGQTKVNNVKEDVTKMVDSAKIKVAGDKTIKNPTAGKCIIFTLSYLDDNEDMKTGPNGGKYEVYDSFVIIKRVGTSYKYYVRLIETADGKYYGVENAEYTAFTKNPKNYIKEVSSLLNLDCARKDTYEKTKCNNSIDYDSYLTEIKGYNVISSYCSSGVEAYYSKKIMID